ncbi:MAG: hypothetical protein LBS12_06740 [Prevotellaceae bacterium]|jgi:hypothetical protein|nr:hypothetical protein [Prevotellaceae bacterium]
MKAKTWIWLLAAAATVVCHSCDMTNSDDDNDDDPNATTLTVEPAAISAGATGGTYSLAVTCNTAWTASIDDGGAWSYLSEQSGNNSSDVIVTVANNTDFGHRSASITFSAGTLTYVVSVDQAPCDPLFTVDKNSLSFDGFGVCEGENFLYVEYNMEWTATLDAGSAGWCRVWPSEPRGSVPSGSTMTDYVYVEVDENSPVAARSGTLTFSAGTVSRAVLITQAAAIPYMELSPTSMTVASVASRYRVTTAGNVPWTAAVNSEAAGWCSLSINSGTGRDTVYFDVTTNPDNAIRTATIRFTADTLVRTLTVVQNGTPPLPTYASSTMTWVYGLSVWSDAIHIPECNKTDFAFSRTESQCRSFSWGWTFYYYNWPYVIQHQHTLCPAPWRVPTYGDLNGLRNATPNLRPILGDYGGYIDPETNTAKFYSTMAHFWSSTKAEDQWPFSDEADAANTALQLTYYMELGIEYAGMGAYDKSYGFRVRCVR